MSTATDMTAQHEGGLLTKRELARELRISTRKIDLDVSRGLPWVQVGARKRFRLEAALRWYAGD